jgi:translation initiation factor 5
MREVAAQLNRPVAYIMKYFGCELGAPTKFDWNGEKFLIRGSHKATTLQVLLDEFIRKCVLCSQCGSAKTELSVDVDIYQQCAVCGYNGVLEVHHRISLYMLKYPPPARVSAVTGQLRCLSSR